MYSPFVFHEYEHEHDHADEDESRILYTCDVRLFGVWHLTFGGRERRSEAILIGAVTHTYGVYVRMARRYSDQVQRLHTLWISHGARLDRWWMGHGDLGVAGSFRLVGFLFVRAERIPVTVRRRVSCI